MQALDPTAPIKFATDPTPIEIPEYPAVITTKHSELVPTASDGRVLKIDVHPGQRVHAGDVLVELDDTELKARALGLAANVRASKSDAGASYAQAQDAARQAQMQDRLRRLGAGTAEAVRQAQASRSQFGSSGAAASERAASAAADLAETQRLIARAKITSPIDGVVVSLRVRDGENASKGQTVARVSDPSDLRVKFIVPQDQRGTLVLGQSIEVVMPGLTRKLFATITSFNDVQEARLAVTVVEADIDDSKLIPSEVSPTAQGHVRIDPGAKS